MASVGVGGIRKPVTISRYKSPCAFLPPNWALTRPDPLRPKWARGNLRGMRIIARRTLREFVEALTGHQDQPAVKAALDAWFDEVKKARWQNTANVKRSYATASIITSDRVVFNVKGNAYRLVVAVHFDKGIVWIKWIGTHKDYDKIDVKEVQHDG